MRPLPEAACGERSAHHVPAKPLDREALLGLELNRCMQVESVTFGRERLRRSARRGAQELEHGSLLDGFRFLLEFSGQLADALGDTSHDACEVLPSRRRGAQEGQAPILPALEQPVRGERAVARVTGGIERACGEET